MAVERKRGCGFRKINGLYLCADGPGEPCHRLPIRLEVCPACHAGIKQTRGWTWVKPALLNGDCNPLNVPTWIPDKSFITGKENHCRFCPACTPRFLGDKVGLLWIGVRFYSTPASFTREAITLGVSRRITAIPKGFKVGEHWVLLAHPKAVLLKSVQSQDNDGKVSHADTFGPGIFHVFKPTRIEKILADNASPKEVKEWEDRGCKVVLFPTKDKDHQGSVYDVEEVEGD